MLTDLSIPELARITGHNPESLRKMAREKRLPGAYRLGGSWRITRETVEQLRGVRSTLPEVRA